MTLVARSLACVLAVPGCSPAVHVPGPAAPVVPGHDRLNTDRSARGPRPRDSLFSPSRPREPGCCCCFAGWLAGWLGWLGFFLFRPGHAPQEAHGKRLTARLCTQQGRLGRIWRLQRDDRSLSNLPARHFFWWRCSRSGEHPTKRDDAKPLPVNQLAHQPFRSGRSGRILRTCWRP